MGVLQIIINIFSTFGVSGLLLFFVKRHYEKKDEALKEGKRERREIKDAIDKIAKQNEEQYEMIALQNDKISSLSDDVKALREQENQNSQADRIVMKSKVGFLLMT